MGSRPMRSNRREICCRGLLASLFMVKVNKESGYEMTIPEELANGTNGTNGTRCIGHGVVLR